MAQITPGTRKDSTLLVTGEHAIDFLGEEGARVLSTPSLIGHLELTARQAVKDLLDAGSDTVGAGVDLRHLAATPLGMCVTLHAEVTGVDGRRVFFKIWAEDEREPVAEGTHERIVINIARFVERLQAKIRGDSA